MLAEGELDEAEVVGVEEVEVVGVKLWVVTEVKVVEILVEVAVSVVVALAVVIEVVVALVAGLDDEEEDESGQNVIKRLASLSWHEIWTQVSSGSLNAVVQSSELHVVFTPSQTP